MIQGGRPSGNWREYQHGLRKLSRRKKFFDLIPLMALSAGGLILLLLMVYGGNRILVHFSEASYSPPKRAVQPASSPDALTTEDLWPLVSERFAKTGDLPEQFCVRRNDANLTVQTTIIPALQDYISRMLDRSRTDKAAVVVLDPNDGRILAMVSHRKGGEGGNNLCLESRFPAASLFKIVSAAAALEIAHFSPDRMVSFLGRAHTLYKNQLTRKVNRYSTKISLRRAFATSVNPVFGKLGIYTLGRAAIVEYARKFFFNRPILFDLPVSPSVVDVPDDSYGLAEISCGFNRRTRISPLHAALFACAVANGGVVMKPWVIKDIVEKNRSVYQAHPGVLGVPVRPGTARNLQVMMGDTIRYGTCRKSFWRMRRKKRFRLLKLGAKTGTIKDHANLHTYDWTTAYAVPKDRSNGICLGILAVHGKILGTHSREIARAIIDYEFHS